MSRTQEVLKSGKGEGRVFFTELEFKESQALFHRLAANSLPWIVHVSPSLNIGSDGPLKIKHEDVVSALGLMYFATRACLPVQSVYCGAIMGAWTSETDVLESWLPQTLLRAAVCADASRQLWASSLEGR